MSSSIPQVLPLDPVPPPRDRSWITTEDVDPRRPARRRKPGLSWSRRDVLAIAVAYLTLLVLQGGIGMFLGYLIWGVR